MAGSNGNMGTEVAFTRRKGAWNFWANAGWTAEGEVIHTKQTNGGMVIGTCITRVLNVLDVMQLVFFSLRYFLGVKRTHGWAYPENTKYKNKTNPSQRFSEGRERKTERMSMSGGREGGECNQTVGLRSSSWLV
ncbi:unnamed protein product [Prunus armeniaca]|uniref:Uncharacterized protein n=1 Tax=Prunus armeniaca TaxID=36596 RepID=A0A6J5WLL2_PRUAR|nr:unnamed protein product [Prunus armeniaca]